MSRNTTLLKPLCLAVAIACAAGAHAADWSDTSISYRYISKESAFVTDANNNKVDVAKQIVALSHISGYKYGNNFFNIDVLKSDSNNPANNGDGNPFATKGANAFFPTRSIQFRPDGPGPLCSVELQGRSPVQYRLMTRELRLAVVPRADFFRIYSSQKTQGWLSCPDRESKHLA